jgi:hypothetical protein
MSNDAIEKIRNSVVTVALIVGVVVLVLTGHADKADWLTFALIMLIMFG